MSNRKISPSFYSTKGSDQAEQLTLCEQSPKLYFYKKVNLEVRASQSKIWRAGKLESEWSFSDGFPLHAFFEQEKLSLNWNFAGVSQYLYLVACDPQLHQTFPGFCPVQIF